MQAKHSPVIKHTIMVIDLTSSLAAYMALRVSLAIEVTLHLVENYRKRKKTSTMCERDTGRVNLRCTCVCEREREKGETVEEEEEEEEEERERGGDQTERQRERKREGDEKGCSRREIDDARPSPASEFKNVSYSLLVIIIRELHN